jgi:MFS family permease
MADLNQALVEIRSIRRQVAQNTEFHGYGPATLFATAIVAVVAGAAQAHWLPEPATHPVQYIVLWLTTGIFCAALIATQMLTRADRLHSGMADEMVRMAVAQFLPAAVAGAILPFVLLHITQNVFWMLPGLWQIIFSLGVFASCRCLPRPMLLVGVWFLLTGLACIGLGDIRSLAPATMSGAYAVGMALVAAIHYHSARKASIDEDKEF